MDFLTQIGPLALASRFRRLADRFAQDVALLYKELNIDFEPRWFPVFYLLSKSREPVGVVDIAKMLGISHPAVNQIAGEMIQEGLVEASKDASDKRRRLLALTDRARTMLPALQGTWDKIHQAVQGMLESTGVDVMSMLARLETLLEEEGVYGRFITEHGTEMPVTAGQPVQIVEYSPQYREAFKRLNLEWIEKYFQVESEDEKILNDPEGQILANGGAILFALVQDEPEQAEPSVVGTCALIKQQDGTFELAKMAVTEKARGRQIGKRLLAASIEKARQLQAGQLVLETNSQLTAAVNLYRKLGFVLVHEETVEHVSPYQRADTRMRLDL